MELNRWAITTIMDAYITVYNDSSTSVKDAKKIKKIIDLLDSDRRKLNEVSNQ